METAIIVSCVVALALNLAVAGIGMYFSWRAQSALLELAHIVRQARRR